MEKEITDLTIKAFEKQQEVQRRKSEPLKNLLEQMFNAVMPEIEFIDCTSKDKSSRDTVG